MNMIAENLQKQINEAMKAGDSVRVSTLRMLSSEMHNEKIEKGSGLTEEEELAVVKKEAKKRKDAIESYRKAGASDRAEQESRELEVLQEYLPAEMSDEEIGKIVDEVLNEVRGSSSQVSAEVSMGQVMGKVMQKVGGRASGDRVSAIVRSKLQ